MEKSYNLMKFNINRLKNFKNIEIEISYYFLLILSLMVSIDKTGISIYFFLSIIIHELGHIIMIIYYKIKVKKLSFKGYGINIEIDQNKYLANYKDIIILLSGSAANFIVIFFIKLGSISEKSIIFIVTNLLIGIFNLLPVESLDGGKIMNIILFSKFSMKVAYNISLILTIIFVVFFSTINFLFIIHGKFNITLTLLCIILIIKIIKP